MIHGDDVSSCETNSSLVEKPVAKNSESITGIGGVKPIHKLDDHAIKPFGLRSGRPVRLAAMPHFAQMDQKR